MKDARWKQVIAWLLLIAYLPMLSATVFHVHPSVAKEAACYDCEHNIAHPTHFGVAVPHTQDCLYCHLLSLPNWVAAVAVAVGVVMLAVRLAATVTRMSGTLHAGPQRLRAPPMA